MTALKGLTKFSVTSLTAGDELALQAKAQGGSGNYRYALLCKYDQPSSDLEKHPSCLLFKVCFWIQRTFSRPWAGPA